MKRKGLDSFPPREELSNLASLPSELTPLPKKAGLSGCFFVVATHFDDAQDEFPQNLNQDGDDLPLSGATSTSNILHDTDPQSRAISYLNC